MKKYGILLVLELLFLGMVSWYFRQPEIEKEKAAYRFSFICPMTWEETARGIMAADDALDTNTKCIGFQNLNPKRRADAIWSAVFADVDGIITAGGSDSEELLEAMKGAKKAGIPVVLVESDLSSSGRSCYIGTDHRAAGMQAGRELVKAVEESEGTSKTIPRLRIGIIVSQLKDENQAARVEGFREALRDVDASEAQVLECESDRMKIRKLVKSMLRENPDINALFCADETASELLGGVLEDCGRGDIKVICFGMSELICRSLQEGQYLASVVEESYQQGYQAVEYLKMNFKRSMGQDEIVYTGFEIAGADFDFESWEQKQKGEAVEWYLY